MQTRLKQSGFTLVEIAIVLVIIGLLLGGILKGQEMITQARIKNVINDFNGITAAYASYQDRYRAIPGDDSGAAARWAGNVSGNGDGVLAGTYNAAGANPPLPAQESNLFWWHLRQSGFIPGPTDPAVGNVGTQPNNAFGGKIGAQNAQIAAGPPPVNALGMSGLLVCSGGIPDKVAIAVDTQLDDQNAQTGSLRAILGDSQTALTGGAPGAPYAETGANAYVVCKGV
jgi:prepilin-type N-terminal cleavage/methylation domain-containing protein